MTRIDEAKVHLETAYTILSQEGLSEKFFTLAVDVGQKRWGRFFGKFGSDNGLLLEIQKSNFPGEVKISIIIRRHRQSFWSKIREIACEAWAIVRGKETSYSMHLVDDEVTKLKDVLRNL